MSNKEIQKLHEKISKKNKENSKVNYKIYNNMFIANKNSKEINNLVAKNTYCKKDVKSLNNIFEENIKKIAKELNINEEKINDYKLKLNGKKCSYVAGSNWSKNNCDHVTNVSGIIINQLDMISKIINKDNRKVAKSVEKQLKTQFKGDKERINEELKKEKNKIINRIKHSLDKSQNYSGISLNKEILKYYMENLSFSKNVSLSDKKIYRQYLTYVLTYKWLKKIWIDKIEIGYDNISIEVTTIENKYQKIQDWVENHENKKTVRKKRF